MAAGGAGPGEEEEEGEGEGRAPSPRSAPRTQKAAGKTRRAAGLRSGLGGDLLPASALPALCDRCPHTLGRSPCPHRIPVSRTASPCPVPHPCVPHRIPLPGTASPCPAPHPRVPSRIHVSRIASPCPEPHPRVPPRIPVPAGPAQVGGRSGCAPSAGASGRFSSAQHSSAKHSPAQLPSGRLGSAQPSPSPVGTARFCSAQPISRRDGSVLLSTAQPSSRHNRAQPSAGGAGSTQPPGRAPRWRPGGAGGNGAGRGGAEESGGTETGPGGPGTAVGRDPAGSGSPSPAAAPVPLGGSAAGQLGTSRTRGRLRCSWQAPVPRVAPAPSEGSAAPWRLRSPEAPVSRLRAEAKEAAAAARQAGGGGRAGARPTRIPGPPPAPTPRAGGIRCRVNPGRAGGIYNPHAESGPDPGFAQNKGPWRGHHYRSPYAPKPSVVAPAWLLLLTQTIMGQHRMVKALICQTPGKESWSPLSSPQVPCQLLEDKVGPSSSSSPEPTSSTHCLLLS
uniref:spidroin-2 n=1 Tax=Lonchura striata TaxID=40157 RepID=UPI000B4C791D|nr:spidroin-2-like [Lonchura striata domestica]